MRENGTVCVRNKERQNKLHLWRVSRTDVSCFGLVLHRVVRQVPIDVSEKHTSSIFVTVGDHESDKGVRAQKTMIPHPSENLRHTTAEIAARHNTPLPPAA